MLDLYFFTNWLIMGIIEALEALGIMRVNTLPFRFNIPMTGILHVASDRVYLRNV